MSQRIFGAADSAQKDPMNVGETFTLFDTVLIGLGTAKVSYNDGWFTTFANLGAAVTVPFFNSRNRNHWPYNNQDVRDALPYAFEIYSLGVSIWGPSTVTYADVEPVLGAQTTSSHLFEIEYPKHTSLSLTVQQDERAKLLSLMAPSGYGVVSGGVGQGDVETAWTYPPVSHASFTQGQPVFTNHWGFVKPLKVPRTASLSVILRTSEYMRTLLGVMPGPYYQPMRAVANDGTYDDSEACAGIQVTLGGKRLVQQRGQYHA